MIVRLGWSRRLVTAPGHFHHSPLPTSPTHLAAPPHPLRRRDNVLLCPHSEHLANVLGFYVGIPDLHEFVFLREDPSVQDSLSKAGTLATGSVTMLLWVHSQGLPFCSSKLWIVDEEVYLSSLKSAHPCLRLLDQPGASRYFCSLAKSC